MADDESRAARQKALAEKKRRLEEIKARRRQPTATATSATSSSDANAAATASSAGAAAAGLDSYIDDLLKTSAPGLNLDTTATTSTPSAVVEKAEEKIVEAKETSAEETKVAQPASAAPASPTSPQQPKVETFEIAIQCEEDDFPPPSLLDEDEQPADNSEDESGDENEATTSTPTANDAMSMLQQTSSTNNNEDNAMMLKKSVASLSNEEKSKLLSSPPFTQFLSTASKRVERLLGAGDESLYGILGGSGWGISSGSASTATSSGCGGNGDFSMDYANEDEEYYTDDDEEGDHQADNNGVGGGRKKKRRSKRKNKQTQEEAYQTGGYFTARATYEFPKFTKGRNVTDIEWCPGHKEWVLASYNSVARGTIVSDDEGSSSVATSLGGIVTTTTGNPSTRHLSPHDPSSSFLQSSSSSSSAIPNEGIVAIYNLSMPHRPEHVFCAGCPILHSQFHPTEHPKLIIGGASSGQVLVWDARVGRYPVQRSSSMVGHDCELVGMKVLGDDTARGGGGAAGGSITTSKLVTASSDGKVNYWSVSNLREPVEHVTVNANLSCLETLHGSTNEGIVCGDERGGLHAILAGTGRDGSSSSKRVVRALHPVGVLAKGDASTSVEDDPEAAALDELAELGHYGMVTSVATRPVMPANTPRGNKETTSATMGSSKGFLRGAGGLMVTTGVDWSTKLWAPGYKDGPLMSFLSNSYDYMCDVQW